VVAGVVATLLIALINPGPDFAFLIAVAVTSIGLVFVFGPDWRQQHRRKAHGRGRHHEG